MQLADYPGFGHGDGLLLGDFQDGAVVGDLPEFVDAADALIAEDEGPGLEGGARLGGVYDGGEAVGREGCPYDVKAVWKDL